MQDVMSSMVEFFEGGSTMGYFLVSHFVKVDEAVLF